MRALSLLAPWIAVSFAHAQWSTPVIEPNLNTNFSEFDPRPTFTGLELYLASNRTGNFDLYRATRAAPYTPWGAPTLIAELSDPGTDAAPTARIDNLEIFWYSSRAGSFGGTDIWRATRTSTTAPFETPVNVTELNTSNADLGPSLTGDGLMIFFERSNDIWTATRPDWFSPFTNIQPVTELNSGTTERRPHISFDGLQIWFTSNRPGGAGGFDTYMAERRSTSMPFTNLQNVAALNSANGDICPGFSVFGDEMFFVSDRPGGLGPFDVYSSRFTGLVGNGIASPSSARDLRFSDPRSPQLFYLAVSSGGSAPGIPIDTRVLPLNFDLIFQLTIGGLPPIMTGYVGPLDQDGIGSGRIAFAGFPQFTGLRFFTAFVVIDPAAPSGIRTISNAHEVLVQ